MSNIRGLYDDKNDEDDEVEKRRRDANNRYVGGIGAQGGGSGLAVEPNNADGPPSTSNASESIFNLAERAGPDDAASPSSGDEEEPTRRTITMYSNGFVVDDGPYRRLDDPNNADFLTSLARGQTPAELRGDVSGGNITVGLIDKRKEEFVETFRSFSGAGNSLQAPPSSSENSDGIFNPSSLPLPSTPESTATTTSIAVRMLDGKRKVIKIAVTATVEELASLAVQASNSTITDRFRIVSGFPPAPITNPKSTIDESGLKGAQIQLQKA